MSFLHIWAGKLLNMQACSAAVTVIPSPKMRAGYCDKWYQRSGQIQSHCNANDRKYPLPAATALMRPSASYSGPCSEWPTRTMWTCLSLCWRSLWGGSCTASSPSSSSSSCSTCSLPWSPTPFRKLRWGAHFASQLQSGQSPGGIPAVFLTSGWCRRWVEVCPIEVVPQLL